MFNVNETDLNLKNNFYPEAFNIVNYNPEVLRIYRLF